MELKDRIAGRPQGGGLTQEQLGELLGVSRAGGSRWESGQTSPDAATWPPLCEKLPLCRRTMLCWARSRERGKARTRL